MGLYQLVYQSHSLVPFERPELMALLTRCQAANRINNITGVLLYTPDGRFLQVIEGEHEAVRNLYNRLLADPRHFDCRVYNEGPCQQRAFADWAMGFRHAQAHHFRTLLGHVPPDTPALLIPRPPTRQEMLALLQDFLEECEVESSQELPWEG